MDLNPDPYRVKTPKNAVHKSVILLLQRKINQAAGVVKAASGTPDSLQPSMHQNFIKEGLLTLSRGTF